MKFYMVEELFVCRAAILFFDTEVIAASKAVAYETENIGHADTIQNR